MIANIDVSGVTRLQFRGRERVMIFVVTNLLGNINGVATFKI